MVKKIVYLPSELREMRQFVDVNARRQPSHRSSKPTAPVTRRNKNHETFEEGYQYELQQAAKYDNIVKRAADELRSSNEHQQPSASNGGVISSSAPAPIAPAPPTVDDVFAEILRNPSHDAPKKSSRFSFATDEQSSVPTTMATPSAPPAPISDPMNVPSGVTIMNWNNSNGANKTTQEASNPYAQQRNTSQKQPSVVVGVRPNPLQSDVKITVGRPKQQNSTGNNRVWTAEDLEAQFMAQPTPSAPAPQQQQSSQAPKVWDASALEAEILGSQPAPKPAASEQRQQGRGNKRNQRRR